MTTLHYPIFNIKLRIPAEDQSKPNANLAKAASRSARKTRGRTPRRQISKIREVVSAEEIAQRQTLEAPLTSGVVTATETPKPPTPAENKPSDDKKTSPRTADATATSDPADKSAEPSTTSGTPVLVVEVENIKQPAYKQTEEIKALTQEIIKTLRDIITMNPLYR